LHARLAGRRQMGLTEALIDHLAVAGRMQGTLIAGARRVETP
jgi:hypothetical protein